MNEKMSRRHFLAKAGATALVIGLGDGIFLRPHAEGNNRKVVEAQFSSRPSKKEVEVASHILGHNGKSIGDLELYPTQDKIDDARVALSQAESGNAGNAIDVLQREVNFEKAVSSRRKSSGLVRRAQWEERLMVTGSVKMLIGSRRELKAFFIELIKASRDALGGGR